MVLVHHAEGDLSMKSDFQTRKSVEEKEWDENGLLSASKSDICRNKSVKDHKSLLVDEALVWSKRLAFQLVFLACLTVFLGLLIRLLLATLDSFVPRRDRKDDNLGMSFLPRPSDPLSTLIRFKHGNAGDWRPLEKTIKDWLKPYSHGKRAGPSLRCKWDTHIGPHIRCHVSKRRMIDWSFDYPCNKAENYGYSRGRPCVYLKPNRMYGWEPEPYYNLTEVEALTAMPRWLKDTIRDTWEKKCRGKGDKIENQCPNLRMVWLSCEGETSADKEYMGYVKYTQYPGFQGYYFPYLNQQNYLSPLVALQFRDLTPGVLVSVHCKLWAKNIHHNPSNPRVGGVRFEMLMD